MKSFIKTIFLKLTLYSCFAALTLGAAAQVGQSITYGTYFGGIANDQIRSIDLLPDGSVAVAGYTGSFNLEVMNPFQQIFGGGGGDGYIAVFNSNGELTYSTFLGGNSGNDILEQIRSTGDGGYIVAGFTQSSNFPTTAGAFQSEIGDFSAGFLSRFSQDHTLIWSTFYGGLDGAIISGVAIDSELNIYLHGMTANDTLATEGVHQEDTGSNIFGNPFVAKFSLNGERIWCTYFYGNDSELIQTIEVSPDGQQVYIAGYTSSTEGIALNAHQETYNGGEQDGFLCAFNAADGTMNWGTYYGGEGFESLDQISVDEEGIIYVSGATTSSTGIATSGSHQSQINGAWDAFLAAFSPNGERLWGTYFGGEETDGLSGGPISSGNGTVTMPSSTRSFSGIATSGAMYPENTINLDDFPPQDAPFLAQFNSDDGTLLWATYLAPDCHRLSFSDVKNTSSGKIILGGGLGFASQIPCPEIITPGSHQPFVDGGDSEAVLMFIQDNTLSATSQDFLPLSIYPNPASREVVIDLPDAPFSHMHLQVIDLSGRVVLNVPALAMGSAIDLDGMAPGLYLVKGAQDGHYFSEKLVVGR